MFRSYQSVWQEPPLHGRSPYWQFLHEASTSLSSTWNRWMNVQTVQNVQTFKFSQRLSQAQLDKRFEIWMPALHSQHLVVHGEFLKPRWHRQFQRWPVPMPAGAKDHHLSGGILRSQGANCRECGDFGQMERRSDRQHRILYLYLWYFLKIEMNRWYVRWVSVGSGGWIVMETILGNFGSWTGLRCFDTKLLMTFEAKFDAHDGNSEERGMETGCKDSNLTSHQIPVFVQESHGRWTSSIELFHLVIDQGLFKESCCDLRMGLQGWKRNPDWTDAATGAGWCESILKLFFNGVTLDQVFRQSFEDISIFMICVYTLYIDVLFAVNFDSDSFHLWRWPSEKGSTKQTTLVPALAARSILMTVRKSSKQHGKLQGRCHSVNSGPRRRWWILSKVDLWDFLAVYVYIYIL